MKPKLKYIVLRFNDWARVNAITPALLPVHPIGRSCGFMLVYDSLRALRKDYPDSEYVKIMAADDRKKLP